jgi:hypothetical protein
MSVLKAFNNHFTEFLNDIHSIFPDDPDIKKAKSGLELLRKANPRLILLVWREYIAQPYKDRIESSDISFFLEKDYSGDLTSTDNSSKILNAIERLRGPIQNMGEENRRKTMKYVQNLTKLSEMYQG